ncbi:MAG: hypothetical protein JNJ83_18225 [Verrucomicrobiaceae bacterium]|nr:hypothetical protein [Verrucomicrobiaceae bacterium]
MSKSPSQPPTGQPSEDFSPRLIFDWFRPSRRTTWVAFCAVVAIGMLAGVSMFFRVTKAEWRNQLPNTHTVVLLDPSSPTAASILNRAANVSALALGRRSEGDLEPQMAEMMPVFQPGFKSYDYRLKDLPEPPVVQSNPTWMTASSPPLPSRPELSSLPERSTTVQAVDYQIAVKPGPLLVSRFKHSPSKPARVEGIDLNTLVFRTAVAENGRVLVSLPLHHTSDQAKAVEALRQMIAQVRFASAPATGVVWEDLRFGWEVSSKTK